MKKSLTKGVGFGLTSGVITTLGLIVGLNSSTGSRIVVISGILVIAIADAMSDALGIHISEESDRFNSKKEIWSATFSTFFTKLITAITFIVPVLFFQLSTAILISIIWGLFLITIFSYKIALSRNTKPYKIIFEHIFIAIIVIVLTNFLGKCIAMFN